MTSVVELWHLPAKNLVGSWETVDDAMREIRAGVGSRQREVHIDHVLVCVEDDDTTTVIAEGTMNLDLPDDLQKVSGS